MNSTCYFCHSDAHGLLLKTGKEYPKIGANHIVAHFYWGSTHDSSAFILNKSINLPKIKRNMPVAICDDCFDSVYKHESKLISNIYCQAYDNYNWLKKLLSMFPDKYKTAEVDDNTKKYEMLELTIDDKTYPVYCLLPKKVPTENTIYSLLYTNDTSDPILLKLSTEGVKENKNKDYYSVSLRLQDADDSYNKYKSIVAYWINKYGDLVTEQPAIEDRVFISGTTCMYKSDLYEVEKIDNKYVLSNDKELIALENLNEVITSFSM